MYCEAREIMNKHEQYVRGWLRLHGQNNSTTAVDLAQYALDLQKLRLKHQEHCWLCIQGNHDAQVQ